MYLHLGNNVMVRSSDVVAVLDLDNASQSHITREYLAWAEKAGRVINAAGTELPKALVVCGEDVYLSQLASSTLLRRASQGNAGFVKHL